jgi:hypothetical protein
MNEEDKKRFLRYKKGYMPTIEEENELNGISNKTKNTNTNTTTKIGFIETININKNVLVNDIIINNSKKTSNK